MTIEELLRPRYMVIADYPNSPFEKVGQVIGDYFEWYSGEGTGDGTEHLTQEEFNLYPHLFKKLQWWEERNIGDLPEYIKYARNNNVMAVEHYETDYGMCFIEGHNPLDWDDCVHLDVTLPSTEAEYNEFKAR